MTSDSLYRPATNTPDGGKRGRTITTPEGAPLYFQIASRTDRLIALLIDLCIVLLAVIVVNVFVSYVLAPDVSQLAESLTSLLVLAFRVCYFPATELRWSGRTPGKRVVGLRVVDRRGGPLTRHAVIARNLLREVELWQPLTLILLHMGGESEPLIVWPALCWMVLVTAIPLFNRDVMRGGDLIAGTWVIEDVEPLRVPDLLLSGAESPPDTEHQRLSKQRGELHFDEQQVTVYGILELEVLADVLRDDAPSAAALREGVAERIQQKIGWSSSTKIDSRVFLTAYYRDLRGHLERQGLVTGTRPVDKHAARPGKGSTNRSGP